MLGHEAMKRLNIAMSMFLYGFTWSYIHAFGRFGGQPLLGDVHHYTDEALAQAFIEKRLATGFKPANLTAV